MTGKKMIFGIIGFTVILVMGGILLGPIMSRVEQSKYDVVKSFENIEIREYAPMIVAEVNVSGTREQSINEGFRMIADYIFGNNESAEKVAMTAPVLQQTSQKIEMTAPVLQQSTGDSWSVRFVMPAKYTLETLPKPKNPKVLIHQLSGKKFAAIRFSGSPDEKDLENYTATLQEFMKLNNITGISSPTYAFFNPPWTLPILRRNEVMIEIKDQSYDR